MIEQVLISRAAAEALKNYINNNEIHALKTWYENNASRIPESDPINNVLKSCIAYIAYNINIKTGHWFDGYLTNNIDLTDIKPIQNEYFIDIAEMALLKSKGVDVYDGYRI